MILATPAALALLMITSVGAYLLGWRRWGGGSLLVLGGPLPRRLAIRASPLLASWLALVVLFGWADWLTPALTARVLVDPGGPAAAAGVRDGDVIVQVDGRGVATFEQLADAVTGGPYVCRSEDAGPEVCPVDLVLERDGQRLPVRVNRGSDGRLRVRPRGDQRRRPWTDIAPDALVAPFQVHRDAARWLGFLLWGKPSLEALGGPLELRRVESSVPLATAVRAVAIKGSFWWPLVALTALALAALGEWARRRAART